MVAGEARGGATLWGALGIISDHAVPYPDRICLAGETAFPDREKRTTWTVLHHAAVVTGRAKRCLYRSIQSFRDARPVYEYTPKLMLDTGVRMRKAWRAEADAGVCGLAPSVEQ